MYNISGKREAGIAGEITIICFLKSGTHHSRLERRPPYPPLERDHNDGHIVMIVPPRALRYVQQLMRRHACNSIQSNHVR
jgi:hypothetical protein